MQILKKSLAVVLAAVMAGSMLISNVGAAELDETKFYGSWTANNTRTEGDTYKTDVPDGRGLFDLRGKAASDPLVEGDCNITAALMGSELNPIWGAEILNLPATDYTVIYKLKLVDDDPSIPDDIVMCSFNANIRNGSGGELYADRTWTTLGELRALAADADAEGYFYYYLFLQNSGDTTGAVNFEIRISGPSDDSSISNDVATACGDNETLRLNKIEIYKGNLLPVGQVDGWNADGHYYKDKVMQVNTLVESKDKTTLMYVGADGFEVKSQSIDFNGATYYLTDNGNAVKNNFQLIDGKFYYFGVDCKKAKTEQKVIIGNVSYGVNANGEKVINNWVKGTYYFGADGKMYTNKFTPDGFAVNASGSKIKNCVAKVGSKYYAFDAAGKLIKTGKIAKVAGKYTIASTSGVVTVNAKVGSYITDTKGYLYKYTVRKVGKTSYALDKKYKIVTGTKTYKIGSKTYVVYKGKVSTASKNHIVKVSGKTYAVSAKGTTLKATKKIKIAGKKYKVSSKGVATKIK